MDYEAECQEEADMIASTIEDEEIEQKSISSGYVIWKEPTEVD